MFTNHEGPGGHTTVSGQVHTGGDAKRTKDGGKLQFPVSENLNLQMKFSDFVKRFQTEYKVPNVPKTSIS